MCEPVYLTIHCQFCGGGIEFPSDGIGAEIACPHCTNRVTLLRPWHEEDSPAAEDNGSNDAGLSRAELLLLAKFIFPQEVTALGATEYWKSMLGSAPEIVVSGFVSVGLVEQVAPTLLWLSRSLPKNELITLAAQHGLGQSGNRETLAKRLLKSDWEAIARRFRGKTYFACTKRGAMLVEKFRRTEAKAKKETESGCLAALQERRLTEAMMVMKSSDSRTARILEHIFHSPCRQMFGQAVLESLRLAAAMMQLTGTDDPRPWLVTQSDDEFANLDIEARMLLFAALHKVRVDEMQQAGITRVEILPPDDHVCPVCRSRKGQVYAIDEVPDVPCEGCSCKIGCRCIALVKV